MIINVPKPKTHRKAGITASLKNMIGCVAKKECLPHHAKGAQSCGGDEYLNKSKIKAVRTFFAERNDASVILKDKISYPSKIASTCLYQLQKRIAKDDYSEGSWYGNDTIWRTIADVNRVIRYADKEGIMRGKPQRKMFIIADMVVSGEKEGPMLPSAKQVGIIAAGSEQVAFDEAIASLMGFDYRRIPSIVKMPQLNIYKLPCSEPVTDSNSAQLIDYLKGETICDELSFVPSSGWVGAIERKEHGEQ